MTFHILGISWNFIIPTDYLFFFSEVLKPPTSIASIDIVYTDIVSLDYKYFIYDLLFIKVM